MSRPPHSNVRKVERESETESEGDIQALGGSVDASNSWSKQRKTL